VKYGLLAAIIPVNRYARPVLFSDHALILWISISANAVANMKFSGYVAVILHVSNAIKYRPIPAPKLRQVGIAGALYINFGRPILHALL
jgi:hypothetical protein